MSGTVEFAPKTKSPPATSAAETGFAPATLPYERRLWRKKVLKVQLKNQHLLSCWNVELTKLMQCANRWSNGSVSEGSNHIPRFEIDDEDSDIIVELNGKLSKVRIALTLRNLVIAKREDKVILPLAILKVRDQLRCTLTSAIRTRSIKST